MLLKTGQWEGMSHPLFMLVGALAGAWAMYCRPSPTLCHSPPPGQARLSPREKRDSSKKDSGPLRTDQIDRVRFSARPPVALAERRHAWVSFSQASRAM